MFQSTSLSKPFNKFYQAADAPTGTVQSGSGSPSADNNIEVDGVQAVSAYTKLERLLGWFVSVVVAFYLHAAMSSFVLGLKAMDKGTWVLYVGLITDVFIIYGLIKILVDVGVNPHKVYWHPFAVMALRFGLPYALRILKLKGSYSGAPLLWMMPLTIVLALLAMVLVFVIRKQRRGKGMYTEQNEASFLRDRTHNIKMTKFLNIVILLFMIVLVVLSVLGDMANEDLPRYGALIFVAVLKYLLWSYVILRLSLNLLHAVKQDNISRIKWQSYFLFITVMMIIVLTANTLFSGIGQLIVWLLMVTLGSAAIFYIND